MKPPSTKGRVLALQDVAEQRTKIRTKKPPRRKLIIKIDEQILLATDSNYKPTKTTCVQNEDSSKRKLEIPKRIGRRWTEQQDGAVLLTIL